MPLDLNNPQEEPTLGLCMRRETTFDEKVTRRIKLREGLRSNHYDGAGVRKIKLVSGNTRSARQQRSQP